MNVHSFFDTLVLIKRDINPDNAILLSAQKHTVQKNLEHICHSKV